MRDSSTYTAERPLEIRSDFDLTAFYIILGLSCLPYVLICLSTRRLRIIICVIYFYWQIKFIHGGIFGGSMSDTFVGRPLTLQDAPFAWPPFFIISGISFLPYVLICTSTTRFRKFLCIAYFIIQVPFIFIGLYRP